MDRTKLAARLEAWIAQEVEAGRLAWHVKKSGDVKLIKGTALFELAPDAEDLVELVLDMPALSTALRKGEALSYRAWSHVASTSWGCAIEARSADTVRATMPLWRTTSVRVTRSPGEGAANVGLEASPTGGSWSSSPMTTR